MRAACRKRSCTCTSMGLEDLLYSELGKASTGKAETVELRETLRIRDTPAPAATPPTSAPRDLRASAASSRCSVASSACPWCAGTSPDRGLAFASSSGRRQLIVYTEVRYSPHLLGDGGTMEAQEGGGDSGMAGMSRDERDARLVHEAVTKDCGAGGQFGVTVNQLLCCLSFQPSGPPT